MFKFYIPLQKGIDIRPYQNYPVPVVRVIAHSEKLAENQDMSRLAEKAQAILDNNMAQIQHWCNARRQEYSLNNNTIDKKTYELNNALLVHTILFDQEIIEVHLYPEAGEEEQDELCLMIVSGNKLYAFPMSSLSDPATMALIYERQLTDTNLANDPITGLNAGTGYKQYKFEGASLSFVISRVKFEETRMRVIENPSISGVAQPHISPVSESLNVSEPLSDTDILTVNGSNQDVYLQSGTYRYNGSSVTQIASTTFSPSYVIPYAIDSAGTYYFDLRSNTTQYNGHAFTLAGDYGFLTDAMNTTDVAQFFLYGGSIWAGNSKSPQARTGYGTVPPDSLQYKYAYDFGFPTTSPTYTPDPPITDFGLTVKVPVFYTGSGDRIQLEDRTITADTEITWYRTTIGGGSILARDTDLSLTFGDYSYTKTDVGREFGTLANGNRPRLAVSVLTKQPAANGIFFQVYRQSYYHLNVLGNYVDEDFLEYRLYSPTGLRETTATNLNFTPHGHASNGRSYLQTYSYNLAGTVTYIIDINGVNAISRFQELEIPNPDQWQLAVMDVPLSRIKKFT